VKSSFVASIAIGAALGISFSPGSALARREARAAGGTHLTFTKWKVLVRRNGKEAGYTASPGGTVRICSSAKLTQLNAYYHATDPGNGNARLVWKPPGEPAIHAPGQIYSSGYFYIASQHGLPAGTWSLKTIHDSKNVGSSSVRVARKRC
jgi:hypothetical protein